MSDHNEIRRLAHVGVVLAEHVKSVTRDRTEYAMDAANLNPTLVSTPNGGVPAWLTAYFDPKAIDIVLAPMAAAQIAPEVKKGDWTTTTAVFRTREPAGQVATYGDWSPNGMSSTNTNYPTRETYAFQTWIEYGERESAMAAAGMIDLVGDKQFAKSLVMAKFQNLSYLRGVAGLKNYGLMTDPNLPTAVAATVDYSTAEPEEIANDVVRMVGLLISQSGGVITGNERLVFAAAPSAINNIRRTNSFGLNADKKIRETYPNLEYVAVPEFDTASGRLVQLWAAEVDGQPTVELGYTEKLRAHRLETYSTYVRQKFSAGTLGAVVYLPFAVTQTLGV